MKILHVPKGVFPVPGEGGVDNYAYMLASNLGRFGHDVHLIADPSEHFEAQPNLVIHPLNLPRLPTSNINWWAIIQTVAALRAFHIARNVIYTAVDPFDLVHVHGPLAGLLISKSYPRMPIVYTLNDPTPYMCFYESSYERILRKVHFLLIDLATYRTVDKIISVGTKIKRELIRWGVNPEKIVVIPNGVNPELFHDGPKDSLDMPFERFCIFAGSLVPRKGVHYLLEALNGVDAVHCVIAGNGQEMGALKSQAESLGLTDRIHFLGTVSQRDISALFSMADFLVLPSLAEGLPLVIVEAMACGIPVIATRISGVTDIVIDEWNGLLIEPGNVQELRQGIITLREHPNLRTTMGNNARETVSDAYTWSAITRRIEEEYNKLLNRIIGNATIASTVY